MSTPTFAPASPNPEASVEQFTNGIVEVSPTTMQTVTNQVPEPTPTVTNNGQTFTAEDLNKVRETEKAKLYPEITRLKSELQTVQEQLSAREQFEAAERAALEAEARAKAEAEMDAKELLLSKETEWETRFREQAEAIAKIENDRRMTEALLQQEQTSRELEAYRQSVLEANADNIIPQLKDFVSGNTVDEINASVQTLVERSALIAEDVKQSQQAARQQMPGARVTYPANGPLDNNTSNNSFTPEQVAQMTPAEYAKHRAALLGNSSKSTGMFG